MRRRRRGWDEEDDDDDEEEEEDNDVPNFDDPPVNVEHQQLHGVPMG